MQGVVLQGEIVAAEAPPQYAAEAPPQPQPYATAQPVYAQPQPVYSQPAPVAMPPAAPQTVQVQVPAGMMPGSVFNVQTNNPEFLAGVLKSLKGDGGPVPMAAAAKGVCANSELCKNPEFLAGVLKSLKGDGGPEPMAAAATGVCANSELCNGQMIPVTVPAGCNAGQLLSVAVPQQRAMVQQPVMQQPGQTIVVQQQVGRAPPRGAPAGGVWCQRPFCGPITILIAIFLVPCICCCPCDRQEMYVVNGVEYLPSGAVEEKCCCDCS